MSPALFASAQAEAAVRSGIEMLAPEHGWGMLKSEGIQQHNVYIPGEQRGSDPQDLR